MKPPLDPVGELVRRAGPREAVPPDRLRRLRDVAHADWQAYTTARARRRSLARFIGAAGVAALVVLGVRWGVDDRPSAPALPVEVATVERVVGEATLAQPRGSLTVRARLESGDRVSDGDAVTTSGEGLVSLRLTSGAVVRVNQDSRIGGVGARALELDHGTIYVDSGAAVGKTPLEVRTPFGLARDIGTRFEVSVTTDALRVRVREGLVQVQNRGASHDVHPRDELRVGADGQIGRRTIATFGPEWAWTGALARPFAIEGRTLRNFLDWLIEETGWQVRFADQANERAAAETTLHGSIGGLSPEQAVTAVLAASGVDHALVDGTLTIRQIARDPAR